MATGRRRGGGNGQQHASSIASPAVALPQPRSRKLLLLSLLLLVACGTHITTAFVLAMPGTALARRTGLGTTPVVG